VQVYSNIWDYILAGLFLFFFAPLVLRWNRAVATWLRDGGPEDVKLAKKVTLGYRIWSYSLTVYFIIGPFLGNFTPIFEHYLKMLTEWSVMRIMVVWAVANIWLHVYIVYQVIDNRAIPVRVVSVGAVGALVGLVSIPCAKYFPSQTLLYLYLPYALLTTFISSYPRLTPRVLVRGSLTLSQPLVRKR